MLVRALRLCLPIVFGMMLVTGGARAATFGPFTLPVDGFMAFPQLAYGANAVINDTYTFNRDPGGSLGTSVVASAQDPNPPVHPPFNFGIKNLTFTWTELGQSVQFTDSAGVFNNLALLTATVLLPGTYHLVVTGTALAGGGAYSYTLSTTPLPAALVLFGTGLLGLSLLGRRRRPAVDSSI